MYTKALLALAPIAAQAAQSARWPLFTLRANVTEQYTGYGSSDPRQLWHNAPIGQLGAGEIQGPLFDNDCTQLRAGMDDHGKQTYTCETYSALLTPAAPYSSPELFYSKATSTGQYAPSELVAGSYKMQIAQKNQKDANGRRAVALSSCGTGSSSIYISAKEPYHLTYDNKEAKNEKFGSFYLCGGGKKGDDYGYGDGIFYRSADEKTPEECGEVIFYPECMPLSYTITTTQGTSKGTFPDGRNQAGHYNATCYVDVKGVTGAPNADIATWFSAPRTSYAPMGKIHV